MTVLLLALLAPLGLLTLALVTIAVRDELHRDRGGCPPRPRFRPLRRTADFRPPHAAGIVAAVEGE